MKRLNLILLYFYFAAALMVAALYFTDKSFGAVSSLLVVKAQ